MDDELDVMTWVDQLGANLRDQARTAVQGACNRFRNCRHNRPLIYAMRSNDPLTVGDVRAMGSFIDDYDALPGRIADWLAEQYPDNVNTNAFCAAIRSFAVIPQMQEPK